jgi:hypothetical protein
MKIPGMCRARDGKDASIHARRFIIKPFGRYFFFV